MGWTNIPKPPFCSRNMHKCAYFSNKWCIVVYWTGALWDLWKRSIRICHMGEIVNLSADYELTGDLWNIYFGYIRDKYRAMITPSRAHHFIRRRDNVPESNFHGAHMGHTWVLSAPGGPQVGPMNLAIRDMLLDIESPQRDSDSREPCLWQVAMCHLVIFITLPTNSFNFLHHTTFWCFIVNCVVLFLYSNHATLVF